MCDVPYNKGVIVYRICNGNSMKRVIKETGSYTIFEDEFEGKKITFRIWHNDLSGVEIKFTDAFAQANGYASTDEMIAQTIGEQGKQELIAMCGYFPEWMRYNTDGKVYFVCETFNLTGEA